MKAKFLLIASLTATMFLAGCGKSRNADPIITAPPLQLNTPSVVLTPAPTMTLPPVVNNNDTSYSNVNLDETHYGNGYVISYPSSYTTQDVSGIFLVMDPDSGSNINVLVMEDIGDIDGMTSSDMEDMLEGMGVDTGLSTFYETTLDGYKCYLTQYTMSNTDITQFIVGDGTDAYFVTYAETPGLDSDTQDVFDAIIDSFDIV